MSSTTLVSMSVIRLGLLLFLLGRSVLGFLIFLSMMRGGLLNWKVEMINKI